MRQPERWKLWQVEAQEPNIEWVKWDDYAALAAENERLRSKLSFSQSISEICKHAQDGETITIQGSISSGKTILADLFEVEQLRAENERLREELDELYQKLDDDFNDAEEGMDAK